MPRSGKKVRACSGVHVEGGVVVEAAVEGVVVDGGGVELLLEPFVGSLGEDAFDFAGAGAEGEAVEELEGALAVVEGDERGWFGWGGGLGSGGFGGLRGGGWVLCVERGGRRELLLTGRGAV